MEKAFENTIIADKFMEYTVSLKSFFKNEFKYGNASYKIPFSHILYTKRKIFPLIRDSCEYVCPKLKTCDGHQFLDFMEMIYQFQRWAVEEKKVYFKFFYFHTFRLTFDVEHTLKPTKIKGWYMLPVDYQIISHLSYSKRMSFLN